MSTPIILLVGQAGSGKDTVAGFMVQNHNAISIAQADPMKRLGALLFGFTEEQLWGPSDRRNAPDERFATAEAWRRAEGNICDAQWNPRLLAWVRDLFPRDWPHQEEQIARSMLGWLRGLRAEVFEKGRVLTPRYMLQTLGTEWGRQHERDLWSNYTIRTALQLLGGGYRYDRMAGLLVDREYVGPNWVVISDGRFRNEVINVQAVGGSVIRIDSPNVDTSAVERAGVAGHASEREQKMLPPNFFSGFILNDKREGLKACENHVWRLMQCLGLRYSPVGSDEYVRNLNRHQF